MAYQGPLCSIILGRVVCCFSVRTGPFVSGRGGTHVRRLFLSHVARCLCFVLSLEQAVEWTATSKSVWSGTGGRLGTAGPLCWLKFRWFCSLTEVFVWFSSTGGVFFFVFDFLLDVPEI